MTRVNLCDMSLKDFQDKLKEVELIFNQHGISSENIFIHFGDYCGMKDMRDLKIEYMMTIRHTGAEGNAILVKLPKNMIF